MSFKRLEEFEKAKRAAASAEKEAEARRDLRRAVREVLPKGVRVPKRGRGRAAVGGVSRREVEGLRRMAARFLDGEVGLRELEAHVKQQVLVILLIDGLLGTEPWRASGGPHGGIVAANARLRYLENATRILEDMRQGRGGPQTQADKLLEGVIEAERTDGGGGGASEGA